VIAPVPFTALLSEYFRKIVPGIKKNGIGKFRKNISELITAIIWIGEGDNGPAIKQVAEGNLPEGRSDRRERSFIACWALLNGA
jgi:hypothetical protein